MKLGTTDTIKFKKLKMKLNLRHWQAVGLLESLWRFAERNSPLGDIGRHPDDDIAAAIEWDGESFELIAALVECRWLDECDEHRLVIHDWADHMPTWLVGNLKRHGKEAVKPTPTKQRAKQATKQPTGQPAMQPTKEVAEGTSQPPSYPVDTNPYQSNPKKDSLPEASSGGGELLKAQDFVLNWNMTQGVRLCSKVTPKRIKSFAIRSRDPTWDWKTALGKFPLKCFTEGDWKPDIDWFLRPDSVLSILEGKYDWEKNNGGNNGTQTKRPNQFESNVGALERFVQRHSGGSGESTGAPVCIEADN